VVKVLLDADLIVYRVGFASQKMNEETGLVEADPLPHALHSCKKYVDSIIDATGCSRYALFLTGKDNFRYKVKADYKAGRAAKPILYEEIRKYLIEKYKATVFDKIEADDALGLSQTDDTIIASVDKDLLMVEGHHYNFVKNEFKDVTHEEGNRFFHQQMLTGDKVDNIIGLHGIGEKKAEKLLEEHTDWPELIVDKYVEHFGYDEGFNRAVQNSMLLWILQKGKQMPIDWRV